MFDKSIITPEDLRYVRRSSGLYTPMTAVEKNASYFLDNYDAIASYTCDSVEGHKSYVDMDATKPYTCRFCGKTYPDVKFTDVAHAISALVGNKSLFLKSECESCNKRFGKLYEDQFSKYIAPYRTASQTKGRGGVPSYKSPDASMRIDAGENGTIIQVSPDNHDVTIGDEIKLSFTRQTYKPLMVYKALVFMALSVIPSDEVNAFDETIEWLNDGVSSKYDLSSYASCVFERFIAGSKPLPVGVIFARRKPGKDVPYGIFSLSFDNYGFQIVVPCPRMDARLAGAGITIPVMPNWMDDERLRGFEKSTRVRNFSSANPVKGEKVDIHFHYDQAIEENNRYKDVADVAEKEGVKPLKPEKE